MAMNGETLKSAISTAISTALDDPNIYKEKITQDAERPYFTIAEMDLLQTQVGPKKYNRLSQILVCYYSNIDDLELYKNLTLMGDKLLEILETISVEVGDGTKSTDMKPVKAEYKIVDDVLQVYLTYNIRVFIPVETVKMNKLTVTTNLKQEE